MTIAGYLAELRRLLPGDRSSGGAWGAVAERGPLWGGQRRATAYDDLDLAGRRSPVEVLPGELYLLSLATVALVAAGWASRVWFTASRASRSYGLRS